MRVGEGIGGEKQREERKEREKEKEKKRERERGKERKTDYSSYDLRLSDDWSPPGRELKSIYSMRTTLQEVGILPT